MADDFEVGRAKTPEVSFEAEALEEDDRPSSRASSPADSDIGVSDAPAASKDAAVAHLTPGTPQSAQEVPLVVGAGPAGLLSAIELVRSGAEHVEVVEERDNVRTRIQRLRYSEFRGDVEDLASMVPPGAKSRAYVDRLLEKSNRDNSIQIKDIEKLLHIVVSEGEADLDGSGSTLPLRSFIHVRHETSVAAFDPKSRTVALESHDGRRRLLQVSHVILATGGREVAAFAAAGVESSRVQSDLDYLNPNLATATIDLPADTKLVASTRSKAENITVLGDLAEFGWDKPYPPAVLAQVSHDPDDPTKPIKVNFGGEIPEFILRQEDGPAKDKLLQDYFMVAQGQFKNFPSDKAVARYTHSSSNNADYKHRKGVHTHTTWRGAVDWAENPSQYVKGDKGGVFFVSVGDDAKRADPLLGEGIKNSFKTARALGQSTFGSHFDMESYNGAVDEMREGSEAERTEQITGRKLMLQAQLEMLQGILKRGGLGERQTKSLGFQMNRVETEIKRMEELLHRAGDD